MDHREAKAALWKNRRARAMEAADKVAQAYGVPAAKILGRDRSKPYPDARHEVMARLWEQGMPLAQIASVLDVDHTTVLYGVRKTLGPAEYASLSPGQGKRSA